MSLIVLQAQLNICVAYGSSKDIAVYQAIGLQPDQIYIIGKVAKKHRKEAVVRYLSSSFFVSQNSKRHIYCFFFKLIRLSAEF